VVLGYHWEGTTALLGRVVNGRREAHGRGGVGAWTRELARWVGGIVAEKCMAAEGQGHGRREAHGRCGAGGKGARWRGGIGSAREREAASPDLTGAAHQDH